MSEEKGRLGAGEACNPEMPIRINKKDIPKKNVLSQPKEQERDGRN